MLARNKEISTEDRSHPVNESVQAVVESTGSDEEGGPGAIEEGNREDEIGGSSEEVDDGSRAEVVEVDSGGSLGGVSEGCKVVEGNTEQGGTMGGVFEVVVGGGGSEGGGGEDEEEPLANGFTRMEGWVGEGKGGQDQLLLLWQLELDQLNQLSPNPSA